LCPEVYEHPDYYAGIGPDGTITSAVVNDLALLRTQAEITAEPILLNNNDDIPQPRDIVRAAGYGLTLSETDRGSLNIVDVSEVPFSDCKEAYREISAGEPLPGLSAKQHICAGPDDVCDGGVCRGDSGGPIMVRRGTKFVQVGVTSVITMNGAKEFTEDDDADSELEDRKILRKRKRRNIGLAIGGVLLLLILIGAVIACYCCTRNRMRAGK